MTGETTAILCTIIALVAGGLAAYWKGQAALSKELIRDMREGDDRVRLELRAEAHERRRETDDKIEALNECYEDHENRLRLLEGRPGRH